jgi:CheY-like chemotaxis protein
VDDLVTVLVVEDEPMLQSLIEASLLDGGFDTALTGSGEEAIELLQSKSGHRALVTDINLLGKRDGWEVARVAREINPALPVVYMTGTHAEDWASKGVPSSVMLTKPFAPAQLVTALSNLLNAAATPIPKF